MSRRLKSSAIVMCLLAVALLSWLDHSFFRNKLQSQFQSGEHTQATDMEKYHAKTFTVVSVIDGDTIDINAADNQYEHTRIRLLGIDAPETHSNQYGVMYFGSEAAEFVKELALGKSVTVYLDETSGTRGKYGRLLAYVRLPDGRSLNEVILAEGFAYADLRFRHSLYNAYQQHQAAARSTQKGLWKQVTREQLPQWLQTRKPDLLSDK
jgi:endonuclease YncB( thermonuclease family)